jgi:hypothetical protein
MNIIDLKNVPYIHTIQILKNKIPMLL